ncbi:hypothetical protein RRG08_023402 [Elysia crispata]|uniref:Uncharacterized protein n=1 Tax=Elysia crispata TaxID=231223 RepID=A0AAE0YF28_9GAST|nr:hypothetical protein RRG08_023402 [Elysia crispata]
MVSRSMGKFIMQMDHCCQTPPAMNGLNLQNSTFMTACMRLRIVQRVLAVYRHMLQDFQRLIPEHSKHVSSMSAGAGNQAGHVKMVLRADFSKDGSRYNLPQGSGEVSILPDQSLE